MLIRGTVPKQIILEQSLLLEKNYGLLLYRKEAKEYNKYYPLEK
jgi:hypothetical protein